MTFSPADLETATAKLSTLDFTDAETAAIAAFLGGADDEVSGFNFEPNKGQGFLLEVAGLMPTPKSFNATGDLTFTATGDVGRVPFKDDGYGKTI